MSRLTEFRAIGGLALQGEFMGHPDDPAIVLLEHPQQRPGFWEDLSIALVKAGRQVVRIAHPQVHSAPKRRDTDTYTTEVLRAILSQLPMRPALIAAGDHAAAALHAVSHEGSLLATGLVLVTPDIVPDADFSGLQDTLPVLLIANTQSGSASSLELAARSIAHAEAVEIGTGETMAAAECLDAYSAVLIDFLERRLPRSTPEYRLGSDARTLRDALGCFATGVTILTARDSSGQPVGLTANSFTSVSLDPPLLLACISNTSASSEVFQSAGHFAVNVLHIGQQPASIRFSRRGEDRFGATPWEPGLHDTPVLTGSLATFECARHAVHEGGDHIILIGQVERARFEPRRDPLLYFRGKYRRLHFT